MVLISCIIAIYLNIVSAWSLFYFINSVSFSLPWSNCENSWSGLSTFFTILLVFILPLNDVGSTWANILHPSYDDTFVYRLLSWYSNIMHGLKWYPPSQWVMHYTGSYLFVCGLLWKYDNACIVSKLSFMPNFMLHKRSDPPKDLFIVRDGGNG